MQKFYFGLSTTFHDPGIALVNGHGDILFAESAERFLQYKRAYGFAADARNTVRRIIKEYCDLDAELGQNPEPGRSEPKPLERNSRDYCRLNSAYPGRLCGSRVLTNNVVNTRGPLWFQI
jgi:predicted NodU family carbamoyl transferase